MLFSKKRKDFGTDIILHDKENDLITYLPPMNDNQFANYAKKRVNQVGIQAAQPVAHKEVQSSWPKTVNMTISTMTEEEIHQKIDTSDKLTTEKLIAFLKKSSVDVEKALTYNETINVFGDDFSLIHEDDNFLKTSGATELSIIREIKSFEYPECKKKSISCIRFQPHFAGQKYQCLATSFVENLAFDERIEINGRSYKNQILMWDYKDMHLFTPVISLVSNLEIITFEFKPGEPNIIIAGAINGQVLVWDLNYRAEENMGFGDRSGAVEKSGPIEITPAVMSIFPELFSVPPPILTDVYSKKVVNSHRSAVQSVKFFPKNIEYDKKLNPLYKDASEGNTLLMKFPLR